MFSLAIALFFSSCGNNSPEAELALNNGMKWEVNAEMMPPLEASTKLISEFAKNDKKDHQALAAKLKENNQLLISSCTMKGESHDELHKWLHPYLTLVEELENTDDSNEANQTFKKIEQSFQTFNQYFQ